MRWPTGSDVTAIRQREKCYSRFYLGVQRGKERTSGCGVHGGAGTIYVGCHYQLGNTDTYDANEHSLTFGTVGILAASDIRPGMTLALGTLADPFLYGSARIRNVDVAADILYLEPNNLSAEGYFNPGEYIWVDGVYRLYRILPYILNGVVYEDGNPDTILGAAGIPGYGIAFDARYLDRPVALMGSPRFAWTGENISFYGWRSHGRGGRTINAYAWGFDGGVAGGAGAAAAGTPANPVTARWNTAGEYIASLTVTDNSGNAANDAYGVPFEDHVAVRPVLVYDRPGGSNPPYTRFEVKGLRGSYGSGWTASIEVFGTADKSEFPDNALVIIFAEDWYGGTRGSRGGWYGQEGILFCGYIQADTVQVDSEKSTVSFEARTIEQWMKDIDCWPINFESTAGAPTAWHEFQTMTCEDTLWYLAEFRSTLKNVTDGFFASDVNAQKTLGFLDVTESSLYDQMSDQIGSCFFGQLSASRHGSVHLFKHKNMMDLVERTTWGPPIWVFAKQDWRDELEVGDERMRDSVAQVDFIGFIYDTDGNPQEVYSLAPERQTNFGGIEKVTGVLLSGNTVAAAQAENNTLSGLYRAWKNIRFPHIRIPAFNNRFLEPATLDYFGITLAASDTVRGYEWSGKEFLCTEVSFEIDNEKGVILADVTGEASTWGPDGVAGDYPEGPPSLNTDENPPEYVAVWPPPVGTEPGDPPPWGGADEYCAGSWQLEHDPSLTGRLYEMVYFNGDVFAFCYNGTGGGVWRRTPPNWTRTLNYGTSGRGCVWNGYMWAGGSTNPHLIYRSGNGVAWVQDVNLACGGPYSHWSAIGGYGSYLYAYQYAMCGSANAFYRRDTAGNWVQSPADPGFAVGHATDIIRYNSVLYWAYSSTVRYYTGAAWPIDPTIGYSTNVFFTIRDSTLFAIAANAVAGLRVYRRGSGVWIPEFNRADGANWGAISLGGNNKLYFAVYDGADSDVYLRTDSGDWVYHSTATGVEFDCVGADADGNLFAGTNSCEFYRYVCS